MDWRRCSQQLRHEVDIALQVLTKLLQEMGGTYAYAKGSAVKSWDSIIDYIPLISDLDIHVYVPDGLDSISLDQSLNFLRQYEDQYYLQLPDAIHLPRIQLLDIGQLYEQPDMVPPTIDQIHPLFGTISLPTMPSVDKIIEIDRQSILELQSVVEKLPLMLIDRTDQELWIALRRLTWRVSPTPVRLLSQTYNDPVDLWDWNRTSIVELLHQQGYNEIAELYTKYYKIGWELFDHEFQSRDLYHQLFRISHELFETALDRINSVD